MTRHGTEIPHSRTSARPTAGTQVLIATTNLGKLREILPILEGLPLTLLTLADLPRVPEPEETGSTFEQNARQKALYYADRSGMLTIAEDSGLEIDALDGEPGVHSARYNGSSYEQKFATIYQRLQERGVAGSAARFVCAATVAHDDRILLDARGTVEGEIAPEPTGTLGFGYDPIFYYGPRACTLAELPPDIKAAVSHRGQAFRQVRTFLDAWAHAIVS